MSFWQTKSGKMVTGSTEDSFNMGFKPIPDNTITIAMIKSFELTESEEYGTKYSVRWKIIDGEFKNREITQNISAFDNDDEKRERALNMMVRIHKLCGYSPTHSNAPTNSDLSPMQGKLCMIKIQSLISKTDGKNINYVSEVHESEYDEEVREESALNRFRNPPPTPVDSDIPF